VTDSIILVWLIAIPFLGGLLSWFGELAGGIRYPRWIALCTMLLVLIMSLWLWSVGDYSITGIPLAGADPQWVLEFQAPWIDSSCVRMAIERNRISRLLRRATHTSARPEGSVPSTPWQMTRR